MDLLTKAAREVLDGGLTLAKASEKYGLEEAALQARINSLGRQEDGMLDPEELYRRRRRRRIQAALGLLKGVSQDDEKSC
jgi:hypothetical protein